MGRSRSRTLYLLTCLAFGALALRPVPVLERGLDLLLLPTRLFSELAAPVGWFQGRDVHASEPEEVRVRKLEVKDHKSLERAVQVSALPSRVESLAGVGSVHAEVVARPERLDTIQIRVADPTGLTLGLPVVSGDWFVGTVSRLPDPAKLDEPQDVLEVRLVTERDARIGGLVIERDERMGGPVRQTRAGEWRLVVGGIAPIEQVSYLDIHNPELRAPRGGQSVVVHEPPELASERTDLANGFLLGELVREENGQDGSVVYGVRPGLDYRSGLYQVLVLFPPEADVAANPERVEVLTDGRWLSARLFLRSEPSPWREGRKLALGLWHDVHNGAALVSGARLVGRVEHASFASSNVRMVGDRGFRIAAIAMYEDDGAPQTHVLGSLRCLGRASSGELRYEWRATLPLIGDGPVLARIWTGSGEVGVPRGLLVGTAELPRESAEAVRARQGTAVHEILIRQPAGAEEPRGLRVRLAEVAQ